MSFDQTEYITGYIKENYDRVEIRVPKGKRQILKDLATQYNFRDDKGKLSVSKLVLDAVEEKYGVDLTTKE